jgi:hypothetical protein
MTFEGERVIACAIEWQEAVDLVVSATPGVDRPDLVARATEAHMALLHAVREYRTGESPVTVRRR